MKTSVRRILIVAAATVLASLLLVFSGGTALAHTGLQSSTPTGGETLTAAPDAVTLTFSSAVASKFAQIAVTGPDGESATSGEVTIDGAMVSQPVNTSGAGAYVVAYRVVSDDGHPVSGQLTFTLTGTGGAATESAPAEPTLVNTPAPPPDTETAVSPAAGSDTASDAGSSWGLWVFLSAVAVVLVAGTWLALRRRSATGG
ncbi:copper resistance CopC family protein [Geodermatophilus marinus]|uniref:copper resistance CopC family protein n=1 Tax=Geodermatophilus sp. LHW52908 TaxID=2303986 RepID=UPI000E3D32C4|nr:copper resistance CopC family protein [Geodermatophilus sp. LHW52908]RFU20643.1 copper resistance protein CopC [Geodermatophilus sp. LHW52908]